MKNYTEARGKHQRIVFDAAKGQFVTRDVQHPFVPQLDAADLSRAKDCGLDVVSLVNGTLRLEME